MIFSKNRKSGFTLMELLIVIAIIGLLSSIILASLSVARRKGRDVKRISDLRQIRNALEIFYDNYGRYPITAGHAFWDGHWMNFQTCVETGVGCGFVIPGAYESPMRKVPQDPLDNDPDNPTGGITYYYSYSSPAPCDNQGYILRVILEDTSSNVLNTDSDGNYYKTEIPPPSSDNSCEDPVYCIKQNWCH